MKQKYNIKIEYDGKYPCLCIGKLFVTIDEKRYEFPDYCLISGGSCGFTNDYEESFVEPGEWSIDSWPEDFPEELKDEVIDTINKEIPLGCCGGCL